MQTTISERAAAADLAERAWTEYHRHIEAGGIVGSLTREALREGRFADALAWLIEARGSDFLSRPVYVTDRPNRHRDRAASRDRRFARRLDRRRGERQWRTEWAFALAA